MPAESEYQKHCRVVCDQTISEFAEEQALGRVAAEKRADALEQERDRLRAALKFYAGRLRADGNGYEFDAEPKLIMGGVAREALAPAPATVAAPSAPVHTDIDEDDHQFA